MNPLAKAKSVYQEWKDKFTQDAIDGNLNRAQLRQYWRQDRRLMGRKRLSFAEWRTEIFSKAPEQGS